MRCEELLAAIGGLVDGDLDPAVKRFIESHLDDCRPCQVVVDNLRSTIRLFKAGQEVAVPAEFQQKLLGVLRARWEQKFSAKP